MASYGRNFHTRVSPYPQQRKGRYQNTQGAAIPIGTPVVVANGATPNHGLTDVLPATLATGAQAPKRGFAGIAIYEWIDMNGTDPELDTFSDRDTIPDGELFQVISGPNVKVVFTNTTARSFMGLRDYTGRLMVAGLGATPTVAIGDYLTPGTGNDSAGYWAETASAANAWLVVTNVDAARQEVEAEFVF
jgi:hypothetical protein